MMRISLPGVLPSLLLWGAAFLVPAPGLSQYEGVLEMKVSMAEGDSIHSSTYRLHVQKGKLAATLSAGSGGGAGGGAFIFRGDRKLLWIVNDDQKSYLEVSMKDVDTSSGKAAPADESKLERTGKRKTILGYACDEFVVQGETEQIQLWATSKLGNVYEGLLKSLGELGSAQMKDQAGWEAQLSAMKLFPLELVTSRNGVLYQTQEVTKIETKKLPSTMFEPPRGYKKESLDLNMEKLMKQMQEKQEAPDSSGN